MKIRLDFVTNSSSSSFTILGKQVNFKDIDLSDGNYICAGTCLSDGDDIFFLNQELHAYLNNQILTAKLTNKFEGSVLDRLTFYKNFYSCYDDDDDDDDEISMKDLMNCIKPDESFCILNFYKDNCSSTSVSQLEDRYGDDNL